MRDDLKTQRVIDTEQLSLSTLIKLEDWRSSEWSWAIRSVKSHKASAGGRRADGGTGRELAQSEARFRKARWFYRGRSRSGRSRAVGNRKSVRKNVLESLAWQRENLAACVCVCFGVLFYFFFRLSYKYRRRQRDNRWGGVQLQWRTGQSGTGWRQRWVVWDFRWRSSRF